ncbi:MAG: hypothetical protein GXY36_18765 [Chloroflexi bacterium]|nr:hypothetical protein [Chloroflexota bacterium]
MRAAYLRGLAVLALLLLAGCTLQSGPGEPGASVDVYADLSARLAAAQDAHAVVLDLWDRIIFGESVSCQEAITVPAPLAIPAAELARTPQADAIQAGLNAAIKLLRDSSDLWNIACADEHPVIPLELAREGRATALAAGDQLDEAAALLAAWP